MSDHALKHARALGSLAAAASSLMLFVLPAAPARAGTTVCTWGGTPAAPTGQLTVTPGTKNTPSTSPQRFRAWGPLAGEGRCRGIMTFEGTLAAGATCFAQNFEGRVRGLPGVARFWGPGAFGVVHEFLYDRAGNVVGSDQPQVLTNATEPGSPAFTACGTPEGFTHGNFSSIVELYGGSGRP
jgi:hypothetical protein